MEKETAEEINANKFLISKGVVHGSERYSPIIIEGWLQEYASQQTAEKDREIEKMKSEIETLKMKLSDMATGIT